MKVQKSVFKGLKVGRICLSWRGYSSMKTLASKTRKGKSNDCGETLKLGGDNLGRLKPTLHSREPRNTLEDRGYESLAP